MTGCPSPITRGLAWENTLCLRSATPTLDGLWWISGAGVSSLYEDEVHVVTHELGHNFGIPHDCVKGCDDCKKFEEKDNICTKPSRCCSCNDNSIDQCDCNDNFIMSPTTSAKSHEFGQCSRQQACKTIALLGTCLTVSTSNPSSIGVCGNGVVDPGEDCDCGSPEMCKFDPCCTSECRFREGAECSDSNGECCRKCKIIPASYRVQCRNADSPCKSRSMCNGRSSQCPSPQLKPDGKACSDNRLASITGFEFCSFGKCTSRDEECRVHDSKRFSQGACEGDSHCKLHCKSGDTRCVNTGTWAPNGAPCFYVIRSISGKCASGQCLIDDKALGVLMFVMAGALLSVPFLFYLTCFHKQTKSKKS